MKKFLENLYSYFRALFSMSGFIVSMVLGLALFAILGIIGSSGQAGLVFVVVSMVSFWIVGVYFVIRNFRDNPGARFEKNVLSGSELIEYADIREKLSTFITALKPTFEKYPYLWIVTFSVVLAIAFFAAKYIWVGFFLMVLGYLILIQQLKLSAKEQPKNNQ